MEVAQIPLFREPRDFRGLRFALTMRGKDVDFAVGHNGLLGCVRVCSREPSALSSVLVCVCVEGSYKFAQSSIEQPLGQRSCFAKQRGMYIHEYAACRTMTVCMFKLVPD